MGRPLNDRFFGDFSNPGLQLKVEAWVPGSSSKSTNAYIVRQRTNTKYEVSDNNNTGICKLQENSITNEGEMRISVNPFNGGTEYVRTLNAHDVKTYSNNTYSWTPTNETADEEGEANISLQ
mgnify:CR=1 FL=1